MFISKKINSVMVLFILIIIDALSYAFQTIL